MNEMNGMVDIHTHILPGMDDGSQSSAESQRMLDALVTQGVSTIVATPHFYAENESPDRFFRRRAEAYARLQEKVENKAEIRLGAEVCYYAGISQTEELTRFTIDHTKLLLIEMPFSDWSGTAVQEIFTIKRDRNVRIVLAHIDRYFSPHNRQYIENMASDGILFQANASSLLLDRKHRKQVLQMIEDRTIWFIGSDCHNMEERAPKLADAYKVIEKKLGADGLDWLRFCADHYFGGGDN